MPLDEVAVPSGEQGWRNFGNMGMEAHNDRRQTLIALVPLAGGSAGSGGD